MKKFVKILSLALLMAGLWVVFSTTSVFADDGGTIEGTPTPTESAGGEVIPTEEPLITETPVVEETPLLEAAATETSVAEELLTETPAVEETPVPDEALPLDGEVILADGAGDPLVLASEETAELLQGGDPYFMVGTQKYAWVFDQGSGWQSACPAGTVSGVTCFEATGNHTIEAVLDYIDANGLVPTDKKIYVEAGNYNEQVVAGYSGIVIDGTSSIFLKQLNGLIGVDGADETTINGNVTVTGTTGGFTLSGFKIYGGVTFNSNVGNLILADLVVENTSGDGVVVNGQLGSVALTDVQSSDNEGNGLYVDNMSPTTAYPVTITNGEFDNNADGSEVHSRGAVTVNGISASHNYGTGLTIESLGAVTVKNGAFSDNMFLDNNYLKDFGLGLHIYNQTTTAAVTLENIQANRNEDSGIWLITIGAISAKNVTASQNGNRGMLINPYTIWTYPTTVSISDSVFDHNALIGLQLHAKGNVTLSYVNASGNANEGVFIDTCVWDGAKCSGTGAVTVLNPYQVPMQFNSNGSAGLYDGLDIVSAGAVTITGVSARGNTMNGIRVNNRFIGKTGGVTINVLPEILTALQQSKFTENGYSGISIHSNGPVAINGNPKFTILIDNNGVSGISVGDSYNPTGSTITIKGVSLYDNPVWVIMAYSKGTITLDSVWVNDALSDDLYSEQTGILLDNSSGSGGISITNAAVRYTGSYGIQIASKGSVTLKNVITYLTGQRGIDIDNSTAASAQPVTLTDVNVKYAHGTGVEIHSRGTVTLNGVNSYQHSGRNLPQYQSVDLAASAYESTWFDFVGEAGATISISMDYSGYANIRLVDTTTGVTLVDSNAVYSYTTGSLMLPSSGTYLLYVTWNWQDNPLYTLNYRYNVTSPYTLSAQHYTGIYIDNRTGSGDVTIQGSTTNPYPWVSENTGHGIEVDSKGNIKLLNTYLHRNQYTGASLVNSEAASAKNVTAGNLDILDSGQTGLHIYSIGAVAMSNISSSENEYNGIDVTNCILVSGKCKGTGAVSLTGTNHVNANGSSGIYIYTIGVVTLNNIESIGNAQTGLRVEGPSESDLAVIPTGGGVTLNYTNNFRNTIGDSEHYSGVFIRTYGPVSLKNLDVYNNNWIGIDIRNQYAASNQPVTLTDVSVWENGYTGINIVSKGTVTLNGVSSTSNYYVNFGIDYGTTIKALAAGPLYFDIVVPDAVNLSIQFSSAEFEGSIALYDPNNVWMGSTYASDGNPVTIDAGTVSGGTYHVEIWNWYPEPYAYHLSVSDPAGVVDFDHDSPIDGIYIINTDGTGNVNLGKTTLSGQTYAAYNTGAGINISTRGSVTVANTTAANNLGNGLFINNSGQAKTNTLTNVTSTENGVYGVSLYALGPVSWTTGLIMSNGAVSPASGVYISNSAATTAASVTLSKLRVYGSPSSGIRIYSKGAVSLSDSQVMDNAGDGLSVITYGAISLLRTKIQYNHDPQGSMTYGAYLDNSSSTSLTPPGITITDSDISYNTYGLDIYSKGAVAFYGVNIENNYDHGRHLGLGETLSATLPEYYEEYIEDYGWVSGGGEASWSFTVTETDYDLAFYEEILMDGNAGIYDSDLNYIYVDYWDVNNVPHYVLQPGEYFVWVYTYADGEGGVYHLGLNADPGVFAGNTNANGVSIHTNGSVTVARSTARTTNNFNHNGWNGLGIWAYGSVTLSDLTATGNLYEGLYLSAMTAAKPVAINRLTLSDNFYKNVDIIALGPISWNTGSSQGSRYGATVSTASASTPQAITISKVMFENVVNSSGLDVEGSGSITLIGVGASNNYYYGIYLTNQNGSGSVSVNNTTGQSIDTNGLVGLYILSKGSVTLTNVGSSMNGGSGIFVDNTFSTASTKPGVTLIYTLDRWVDYNSYRGIDIQSLGSIKLTTTKKLYVDGNSDTGVYLDNTSGGTTVGVTVGGVAPDIYTAPGQIRITNHWSSYGLFLYSQGPVVLSNTYANNTYYDAILIGNEWSESGRPSSVSLTNIIAENAGSNAVYSDGVHIHAVGPVTVTKVQVVGAYGDGVDIFSTTGIITVKKAITEWNGSDGNRYGIMINGSNDVILDSIISSANDHNLYINTTGAVNLLGTYYKNEFNDSTAGNPVIIYAGAGGITLNRADMINNSGSVVLETTGKLTVKTALVQYNKYGILAVAGNGAVFNKLFVFSNGLYDSNDDGVYEVFTADGLMLTLNGGTVSFTDSAFIGNTGSGIEISFYADPPYPLTFLRTMYFGNDIDYTGDLNLHTYNS